MKTIRHLCLALSMTLALSSAASADAYHHRGRHYSHHHHGNHWGGTAALLAITGVAVGASIYSYNQPPAPVYNPPPRVIYAPPANPGIWYFCHSSGQYYPYVRQCYEGWEAVYPPPR